MYAMSSDPFVRPFACYVGHRAMCTIRFHSIPPLCSHAERGEGDEAAKGTSAKPAPSPSLLSPIESRLARLGARSLCSRNNVLTGCAEYLASKQQASHQGSRQLPSSMQERCETARIDELDIY